MPYDRTRALQYAREWALQRHPAWGNFDAYGGDCTNFISQCLYAGTGEMDVTPDIGWYYRSMRDRAPAWSGVFFLRRFLTTRHEVGPHAVSVPLTEAIPGDVILLSFDGMSYEHATFLLATEPPRIAAHTVDSLDRPLSTYVYRQLLPLHIL